MRERVLAFVRAIVKSAHLNMNKSRAVGSPLACFARPFARPSVRPTVLTISARSSASADRVFYTCAFMDCLTAAAYKLEER